MDRSVSSTVRPVAIQPGKSGTYAEKFAPASSITIAYFIGTSLILETSLLKDTVESSGCQVVRWFAGNRHTTRFALMLQLTMTSATGYLVPSVFPQQSKCLSNFHSPRLTERRIRGYARNSAICRLTSRIAGPIATLSACTAV